jgi:hypothetical protein
MCWIGGSLGPETNDPKNPWWLRSHPVISVACGRATRASRRQAPRGKKILLVSASRSRSRRGARKRKRGYGTIMPPPPACTLPQRKATTPTASSIKGIQGGWGSFSSFFTTKIRPPRVLPASHHHAADPRDAKTLSLPSVPVCDQPRSPRPWHGKSSACLTHVPAAADLQCRKARASSSLALALALAFAFPEECAVN